MTVDDRMFSDAESRRDEWNRLKPFFDEIMSNDEENIIILNYSCTSGTASANGCVLSDINITDNLHSYKPPFCERHRWGYEKVLSRID